MAPDSDDEEVDDEQDKIVPLTTTEPKEVKKITVGTKRKAEDQVDDSERRSASRKD
jgi:hypothetical protein